MTPRTTPPIGAGPSRGSHPWDFPQVHISRFGVIPKGSTGKWCLILDMSSPEGKSVNDEIQEFLCSLSYVGVVASSIPRRSCYKTALCNFMAEEFYANLGIRVTMSLQLGYRTTQHTGARAKITDGHIDTRILAYARVYGRLTIASGLVLG